MNNHRKTLSLPLWTSYVNVTSSLDNFLILEIKIIYAGGYRERESSQIQFDWAN
jgi:hypothetical protein